jgi:hypothetical protein
MLVTARANIAQASLSQAPGKISSGRRGRLTTYSRTKSFPVAGTWTTKLTSKSPFVFQNLTTVLRASSVAPPITPPRSVLCRDFF